MRPRSDAGFTLAEVLAALLVTGLALGGVGAAMSVAARMQQAGSREVERSAGLSEASERMREVLARSGPVDSHTMGFSGGADRVDFACGHTGRCGAQLSRKADSMWLLTFAGAKAGRVRLPDVASARFRYVSDGFMSDTWPVTGAQVRRLTSIAVIGRNNKEEYPLISASIWSEQARQCDFDTVSSRCRAEP